MNSDYMCVMCGIFGDEIPIETRTYCDNCGQGQCLKCKSRTDLIKIREWQYISNMNCSNCGKLCCDMCISTCTQCAAYSEIIDFPQYCYDCDLLNERSCPVGHTENVCEKCKENECVECIGNRGYATKHQ